MPPFFIGWRSGAITLRLLRGFVKVGLVNCYQDGLMPEAEFCQE
jgi:hypothetical protein